MGLCEYISIKPHYTQKYTKICNVAYLVSIHNQHESSSIYYNIRDLLHYCIHLRSWCHKINSSWADSIAFDLFLYIIFTSHAKLYFVFWNKMKRVYYQLKSSWLCSVISLSCTDYTIMDGWKTYHLSKS
jgi:hypothetical protein